jgi:type II secretory pathway component HofQ
VRGSSTTSIPLITLLASITSIVLTTSVARAERDLCAPNTRFRGAVLDLDAKNADIHDVYRLLSDVGRVNIVVPDDVKGKVTLRLKRVPWDQIACTVAAVHRLDLSVNGNVVLVMPRPAARRP